MKWSRKIYEPYSLSYRIKARKNGFKASVVYNDHYKTYYFLTEKNSIMFNSCWDRKEYWTEEDCKLACEQWIDERKK